MTSPLQYAERIAYSSKETLKFTYDCAVKFKDSPGVYVECGVAAGAQIIAMAYGAPNKIIYAFDSFEGIPLPSNHDDQMPGIRKLTDHERKELPDPGKQVLESSGATSVPFGDFNNHLNESGINRLNVKTWIGWFEETMPSFASWSGFASLEISILRLDGDLYNSTYVCLKHLFPKVIEGGIVIIDDWQLQGCRDAVYDYFTHIKGVYDWPLKMQFISNIAYFYK